MSNFGADVKKDEIRNKFGSYYAMETSISITHLYRISKALYQLFSGDFILSDLLFTGAP